MANPDFDGNAMMISIHSLRVEGDLSCRMMLCSNVIFQSTPSVWRETVLVCELFFALNNFNPLPPCGGRLGWVSDKIPSGNISIHSLRVEGDH